MSSDTHNISLRVQPENDTAYAFAKPKDGGEQLMITESDIGTMACEYTDCGDYCDATYKYLWYYRCLDSACSDCEVYDYSCDCYTSPYE